MQTMQRLGIAVGAPVLLAGLVGGAVAFASNGGGGAGEPHARSSLSQQEPGGGAEPRGKDGCPEKEGEGASASEL